MLKKMLIAIAKWVIRACDKRTVLERELDKADMTVKRMGSVAETHFTSTNRDEKDMRSAEHDQIDKFDFDRILEDIQAELIAKSYKALPDILWQYPVKVVQQYVIVQMNILGQYDPEKDNLESKSREELTNLSVNLNQEIFRLRQIEQGKANVSEAQKNVIVSLSERLKCTVEMPKDKFAASKLIEKLKSQLPKVEMAGNMTAAQHNAIERICKVLEKDAKEVVSSCKSVKEASEAISALKAEIESHPELTAPKLASNSQIEFVKRLYKQLNKRFTKKAEEKFRAMTIKECSEAIGELKKLVPDINDATEGQVEYIISLCTILNRPVNASEVKKMDKLSATNLIDGLRRDYLYLLYKASGSSVSKEEIAEFSRDTVKKCIEQLLEEKKLHDYRDIA
jgi:hypothetical protein